jgi:predicted amidophosphoribosyltransferase
MDPLTIYLLLVAGAAVLCIVAMLQIRPVTRVCPGCGADVATDARGCRACGYRFA